MEDAGGPNMESTLKAIGGCGKFQVLMVISIFTAEFASPFSLMFMTFGNYNPGWRCMDSTATLMSSTSNGSMLHVENENETSELVYVKDDCPKFKACNNVQFNPESSTIVTEWHLVCDKAWVSSVIISIQMVGVMIGAFVGGYIGDMIGRQRTICLSCVLNGICNLITAFSSSWYIFTCLRFFVGLTYACMVSFPFVYASELTHYKWRSFLASLPAWNFGAVTFAVVAMLTKDWRHIHFITAAMVIIVCLPILWVPESLRWLTVKGKVKAALKVATRIANINKRAPPKQDTFVMLAAQYRSATGKGRGHSFFHLWRKDVRKYTLILSFIWFSVAIIYFTTSFGVKNLVGDLYVNLIIMFLSEIPVSAVSTVAPNILGRKWAIFSFFSACTISLFSIVFLDRFCNEGSKGWVIFGLVILARFCLNGAWYILYTVVAEIYPTVIRATSLGYGSSLTRIGGIIAPYLIPNDSDSNFISFLIMACLISVCSILLLFLPETKDKVLLETWSEEALPTPLSAKSEDAAKISDNSDTTESEKVLTN